MKSSQFLITAVIVFLISTLSWGETTKAPADSETAIFAGGCFWCMQGPFDDLKKEGVISVTVGYTGGTKDKPTYEETSAGNTGHREAVEVVFDPKKIAYSKLLKIFWANVDPVDKAGQFCDKGEQYTSAVFYSNDAQKKTYEDSLESIKAKKKVKGDITTVILPTKKFYAAEDYHQSYYTKNPIRYKYYRSRCGRDDRLKEVWGEAPKH